MQMSRATICFLWLKLQNVRTYRMADSFQNNSNSHPKQKQKSVVQNLQNAAS